MKRKILFLIILFVFSFSIAYGHDEKEISFYNNIINYIYIINENLYNEKFCYGQYKEMRDYLIDYMARASYSKEIKNYVSELLIDVKTGIKKQDFSYFNEAFKKLQSGLKIYTSNIYITK